MTVLSNSSCRWTGDGTTRPDWTKESLRKTADHVYVVGTSTGASSRSKGREQARMDAAGRISRRLVSTIESTLNVRMMEKRTSNDRTIRQKVESVTRNTSSTVLVGLEKEREFIQQNEDNKGVDVYVLQRFPRDQYETLLQKTRAQLRNEWLNDPDLALTMARAFFRQGNYRKVVQLLGDARDLRNPERYYLMARAHASLDQIRQARRWYNRLVDEFPHSSHGQLAGDRLQYFRQQEGRRFIEEMEDQLEQNQYREVLETIQDRHSSIARSEHRQRLLSLYYRAIGLRICDAVANQESPNTQKPLRVTLLTFPETGGNRSTRSQLLRQELNSACRESKAIRTIVPQPSGINDQQLIRNGPLQAIDRSDREDTDLYLYGFFGEFLYVHVRNRTGRMIHTDSFPALDVQRSPAPLAPDGSSTGMLSAFQVKTRKSWEKMHPGQTVKSSQSFRVHLKPEEKAYVYLLMITSDRTVDLLFPNNNLTPKNPLSADRFHMLPGREKRYHFDRKTGLEQFYLVASPEELSSIPERVNRITSLSSGSQRKEQISKLKEYIQSLSGPAALSTETRPATGPDGNPTEVKDGLSKTTGNRVVIRTMTVIHQ